MKLTCNRDNLIEGINTVQKAVPFKSPLSVLEGILLEVGEELRLTGNDGEFGIVYEVPGIIEEIGSIVVNSKTFGDIVRKLPDIYVSLETDDTGNVLHVTSGKASYKLNVISPENYPPVSFLDTENAIEMNSELLCSMIRETSFAASLDDKRIILKGVFMEQHGSEMNCVAIDGFRLALKTATLEESRDFGVIVPTKILNELVRSVKSEDETVRFCCNDNQIMFYTDVFRMVSKLYKGEYIHYRTMIPREFKTTVTIDTKSLLSGFERAVLVVIDEKRYPLTIHFTGDDAVVLHVNAENGTVREEIAAEVLGEEMEVGFSARNFIECLKVIQDDKIVISLTSPVGPCLIRGAQDPSFTYLLMPIKTKG